MSEHPVGLAHHFDDMEQQTAAASLGMWLFLVTEIMFFGGLFAGYTVYRWKYPVAFAHASHETGLWLGMANTMVLLASSFTMAVAVRFAQLGKRRLIALFLILTIVLGCAFLVVKGFEYHHKYVDRHIPGPAFVHIEPPPYEGQQMYFLFYFTMTGMHALHMVVGVGLLAVVAVMAWRGRFTVTYNAPVEMVGLYWHFVDVVWIFLFPLLYLIDRHSQ